MSEPTATQAVILRALTEPGAYLDARELDVYVSRGGTRRGLKLTPQQFAVLLKHGWVARYHPGYFHLSDTGRVALMDFTPASKD